MFYSRLTMDQVSATYKLIRFLERLKVIGHLSAHTEKESSNSWALGNYDLHDLTGADYAIVKDGYSHGKNHIDEIIELEHIFGRLKAQPVRGTD